MDICETCNQPVGKFPVIDDLGRQFCSIDCLVEANFDRLNNAKYLGVFVPKPIDQEEANA